MKFPIKKKYGKRVYQVDLAQKYKEQIVASSNIRLLTHANLVKIQLNEYGTSTEFFEIATIGGKKHKVKAKKFVVVCGALQNARQLLNSNNVISTRVGNKSDNVGRFFMEHPHVNTSELLMLSRHNPNIYLDHSLNSKVFSMLVTTKALQKKEKLQNYSARIIPKNRFKGWN